MDRHEKCISTDVFSLFSFPEKVPFAFFANFHFYIDRNTTLMSLWRGESKQCSYQRDNQLSSKRHLKLSHSLEESVRVTITLLFKSIYEGGSEAMPLGAILQTKQSKVTIQVSETMFWETLQHADSTTERNQWLVPEMRDWAAETLMKRTLFLSCIAETSVNQTQVVLMSHHPY